MQVFNFTDQVINKKYKISHQINKGSFGLLYKAKDLETDLDVAVKIEPYSLSKKYLIKEARILNMLQKSHHVPRIFWCGSKPNSSFLVMELLGKNLDELFLQCGRKLSLKTVLMLADQMISNLEFIHSKGFLHRDINPRNICVGLAEKSSIFYSIDFGLSSNFRELTMNDQLKEDFPFVGTLNFASVKSHKGSEQTCSDDLESLFYVIIYFLRGKLPWENIANEKCDLKRKIEEIKQEKINTKTEELCQDLPEELIECINYIRGLEFYTKPDYKFLKKKCEKLYAKKYGAYDFQYDWSRNEEENEKEQLNHENKERIGMRHHKKGKSRLIKEEQKFNNPNEDDEDSLEKYEEQKVCEPIKKKEDETNRRKNSFAKVVPDQIYHIKKKVKIDNAVNLIEKTSSKVTKEKVFEKKEGKAEKNEEESKIEKKENKNEQKNEEIEEKQKIEENKEEQENEERPKTEESLENEKLKSTVKKNFDLLFGKEENCEKRKEGDDKGYCRVF